MTRTICPSLPNSTVSSNVLRPQAPGKGSTSTHKAYTRTDAPRTSYLFSAGQFPDFAHDYSFSNTDIRQGMFGNNGAARFALVTDGLSNTIAFGEAEGGKRKINMNYGPWGLVGTHTCCHGRIFVRYNESPLRTDTLNKTRWHLNADWIESNGVVYPGQSGAWVFNSMHPGGANFCLGDGSTRFISEMIHWRPYAQLGYIHDGATVEMP